MDTAKRIPSGKVYRLVSEDGQLVYIGSTVDSLQKRLRYLHNAYARHLAGNGAWVAPFDVFQASGGPEKCRIELVEDVPCDTMGELRARQAFHIDECDCVNRRSPSGTRLRAPYKYTVPCYMRLKGVAQATSEDRAGKGHTYLYCKLCGGRYTYGNRTHHERSSMHRLAAERPRARSAG